jgi:gamma-tubulin complex component 2
VISRKTILRYQLLFRFLLHLKHVEQALSAMWLEQQGPVWRRTDVPRDFATWRLRLFALRARMLAWVQQILAFVTQEVLEPNWRALEAKLSKVVMVDQLLRDHVDFLDTCMKECMLTSSKLLNVRYVMIISVVKGKSTLTFQSRKIGFLQAYRDLLYVCFVHDLIYERCE